MSILAEQCAVSLTDARDDGCADLAASGVALHVSRPALGSLSTSARIRALAVTDERRGTPLVQRRVLGPSFDEGRGPEALPAHMLILETASCKGKWQRCKLHLSRCAAVAVADLPLLAKACCIPGPLPAESQIPEYVFVGMAPPPLETAPSAPSTPPPAAAAAADEAPFNRPTARYGASLSSAPSPPLRLPNAMGRAARHPSHHHPHHYHVGGVPRATTNITPRPISLRERGGERQWGTPAQEGGSGGEAGGDGRPAHASAVASSLFFHGDDSMELSLALDGLLVVLPPLAQSASAPDHPATGGRAGTGGAGGGWAVGVTLSGALDIDTTDGYEQLRLRLSPRVDGSPLAPLEEAPPSWLDAARPLRCPPTPLLLPTELSLQYAAHGAYHEGAAAAHSPTAQSRGAGAIGSPPPAAARDTVKTERLLDVHMRPLTLEASPSQLAATWLLLTELSRDAAHKIAAARSAGAATARSAVASSQGGGGDGGRDGGGGGGSDSDGARSPPDEGHASSVRGVGVFLPRQARGLPVFTPRLSPPTGAGTPGVGRTDAASTWLRVAQAGSLRSPHDLSSTGKQFLRKLQMLHKRRQRASYMVPFAGPSVVVTPIRRRHTDPAPGDASPSPAVAAASAAATAVPTEVRSVLRTEARVSLAAVTLRLRAEGSRGAFSAPLLETSLSESTLEASLQQKRSNRSSRPSLRQLWDVDRLHAKACATVACNYLNGKLGVLEPLVEPWRVTATVAKPPGVGARDPAFSVRASPLNVNVSRALVRLLESEHLLLHRAGALSLLASAAARAAAVDGRVVRVTNRSGLVLRAALLSSASAAAAAATTPSSGPAAAPGGFGFFAAAAPAPRPPPIAAEWRVLPEAIAVGDEEAIEMPPVAAGRASTHGAGGDRALWIAFALPGSEIISQMRLKHDGAHALSLRRVHAHAAPHPPPRSGDGGGGSGGASEDGGTASAAPPTAPTGGGGGFDDDSGLLPLVCEVMSTADGETLVKLRSTLRLHNKCASALDLVCELPAAPPPPPPRRASRSFPRLRRFSSAATSTDADGLSEVGGSSRSLLARSEHAAAAAPEALAPPTTSPAHGDGFGSGDDDDDDSDEEPPTTHHPFASSRGREGGGGGGGGGGGMRGPLQTLSATIAPDEVLELPMWALEPHARLHLKRASSRRWDAPITPIAPSAEDLHLAEAAAAEAVPGEEASGAGRSLILPSLELFDVAYTNAPLIDAADDVGGGLRSLADVTLTVTWRARLQNLLPVDVEVLAGADGGAIAGVPRPPLGGGGDRPSSPVRAVIARGEDAELPIDELPIGGGSGPYPHGVSGGGGDGSFSASSRQGSMDLSDFRQLAERAIFEDDPPLPEPAHVWGVGGGGVGGVGGGAAAAAAAPPRGLPRHRTQVVGCGCGCVCAHRRRFGAGRSSLSCSATCRRRRPPLPPPPPRAKRRGRVVPRRHPPRLLEGARSGISTRCRRRRPRLPPRRRRRVATVLPAAAGRRHPGSALRRTIRWMALRASA